MQKYLFHNSSVNYCYCVGRATFNLSICVEDRHENRDNLSFTVYTSSMETLMVSCSSVFYSGEGNCSQS